MCCECWKNYDSPKIDNDLVREGFEAVKRVYEFSVVGGNLHAQLDDYNISDVYFDEFEVFDEDASTEQIEAEKRCFDLFKRMTVEERVSVLGLDDGCWKL